MMIKVHIEGFFMLVMIDIRDHVFILGLGSVHFSRIELMVEFMPKALIFFLFSTIFVFAFIYVLF